MRLLHEDTLGELELRLTLQRFLPSFMAWQSAAGWSGDRYQLLERVDDGFLALVLVSAWDTAGDAQGFFTAYSNLVAARHGSQAVLDVEETRLQVWSTPEGVARLQGAERQIVFTIAPEHRQADRLAELARWE